MPYIKTGEGQILAKCIDVHLFTKYTNTLFLFFVNADFTGCWWEDGYFVQYSCRGSWGAGVCPGLH